eukprot:COSAG05_NODE_956_length_6433_cov_1.774708_6_plen_109_part_00
MMTTTTMTIIHMLTQRPPSVCLCRWQANEGLHPDEATEAIVVRATAYTTVYNPCRTICFHIIRILEPCMAGIYLHFIFDHYGLYGNTPVQPVFNRLYTVYCILSSMLH